MNLLKMLLEAFTHTTQGKWEVDSGGEPVIVNLGETDHKFLIGVDENGENNANFVALAHELTPNLLELAALAGVLVDVWQDGQFDEPSMCNAMHDLAESLAKMKQPNPEPVDLTDLVL